MSKCLFPRPNKDFCCFYFKNRPPDPRAPTISFPLPSHITQPDTAVLAFTSGRKMLFGAQDKLLERDILLYPLLRDSCLSGNLFFKKIFLNRKGRKCREQFNQNPCPPAPLSPNPKVRQRKKWRGWDKERKAHTPSSPSIPPSELLSQRSHCQSISRGNGGPENGG